MTATHENNQRSSFAEEFTLITLILMAFLGSVILYFPTDAFYKYMHLFSFPAILLSCPLIFNSHKKMCTSIKKSFNIIGYLFVLAGIYFMVCSVFTSLRFI